ncbi:MAG: MBL fold metallo-hydrolase [Halobacteriales archaeon]|nr:MBL fold metallo-hydrolase [Halobacteriales archaeon]
MPEPRLEQVARAASGCLAYLVADLEAREAMAIDPQEPEPMLARAAQLGVRIVAVVETHTHADHRSGARELGARTGARIVLPWKSEASFPHDALHDGQDLRIGDVRVRAVDTPGHTRDAMSLLLPGKAIVGDTLLPGSPGRADFYERGPEELYHTIFDTLLKLDDSVVLYPGHYGPKHGLPEKLVTTLGEEKRVDEALSLRNQADFVRYMTEGWPPKPHGWEAMVAANLR